jgi:lysophospholipase
VASPDSLRRRNLTHDRERYLDEVYWWQRRPELRLGPPSWGWVEQALASGKRLSQAGALERIKSPVLLLAAKYDQLVETRQILRAARRIPNAELVLFRKGAAHELLREGDVVRLQCLAEIDSFFDQWAP